jgi:hypothetical protein
VDGVNVLDSKINLGTSLRFLAGWHYSDKKTDSPALKESHLRGSGEEKRDAENVAVERHAALEIVNRMSI